AAKAGVEALTRSLAIEWARHRIRVNCLAAGPIDTEQTRNFFACLGRPYYDAEGNPPPAHTLSGRRASPREIALAVLFLASEAGSFVNGQVLYADGGNFSAQVTRPAH